MPPQLPEVPQLPVDVQVNVPPQWLPWVVLGLGVIVLLFGRSLYWVFVAIVGFLIGMEMANVWMAGQEDWMRLLVAIGAGVLGAIIGIFVQRLAFAIGGFFAAGYFAVALATRFHLPGDPNVWMVVGGIIGAILAALLMDWAIIVLSSLAGAAAIMSPFQPKLEPPISGLIYLALVVVGIVFQGRRYLATRVPPGAPPPAIV
jgi:hypothetical protein